MILPAAVVASLQAAPMMAPMRPVAAGDPSAGVSVTGSATVWAPADEAHLVIYVSSADGRADINAAKLQPLTRALAAAGADPSSIQLALDAQSGAYVRGTSVSAVIAHPTPAMVQRGVKLVGAAVMQMQSVNLANAQARLTRTDCSSLFERAQSEAVRNARAHAEQLARLVHERLGQVLAIDEQSQQNPGQGNGCTSFGAFGSFGGGASDEHLTDVSVPAFVRMRYALMR